MISCERCRPRRWPRWRAVRRGWRLAQRRRTIVHPVPRADACILLWMAGGMASPETFDPEAVRAVREGAAGRARDEHVPGDRHGGRQHQVLRRAGAHRPGDGPRHADPLARAARSRPHPAHAASVSLAHRLRAAADGGRAAPRRVDGPRARAAQPGDAGVHRHRPAARRATARRKRSRRFTRPASSAASIGPFMLPYPEDAANAVRPPKGMSPERFEARYRQYRELVLRSPLGEHGSGYQQESMIRGDGECLSAAEVAGARGVRPGPGAARELRRIQRQPLRLGLPARAAAGRGGVAVRRSDDRVRAVRRLGHARGRPHADRENESSRSTGRSRG